MSQRSTRSFCPFDFGGASCHPSQHVCATFTQDSYRVNKNKAHEHIIKYTHKSHAILTLESPRDAHLLNRYHMDVKKLLGLGCPSAITHYSSPACYSMPRYATYNAWKRGNAHALSTSETTDVVLYTTYLYYTYGLLETTPTVGTVPFHPMHHACSLTTRVASHRLQLISTPPTFSFLRIFSRKHQVQVRLALARRTTNSCTTHHTTQHRYICTQLRGKKCFLEDHHAVCASCHSSPWRSMHNSWRIVSGGVGSSAAAPTFIAREESHGGISETDSRFSEALGSVHHGSG